MRGDGTRSPLSSPRLTGCAPRPPARPPPAFVYGTVSPALGPRLAGRASLTAPPPPALCALLLPQLFLLLRYLGCLRAPLHADHAYSWGGSSDRGNFGGGGGGNGNVSLPPANQLDRPATHPDRAAAGDGSSSSRAARKPGPTESEIEAMDIQVRVSG